MNRQKAAYITNLTLGAIMPTEQILEAYFNNKPELIVNALGKAKDPKAVMDAIELANYEVENEQSLSGKSNYGDIQAAIVEQLVTQENVSFFETNSIQNEEVLGESCPNLDLVQQTINLTKQQGLGMEMVK